MSLDGTKIIDGDLAHDIHIQFMDLYDSKLPLNKIKAQIEQWDKTVVGDIENDIYKTVYAQCLWEIGEIDESKINDLKNDLDNETYLKSWKSEGGEIWYKERKTNLKRFITKISKPKKTPRKRKKYHKVKNFIFDIGDVVTYQLMDGKYYMSIISNVAQVRNECLYMFTYSSYKSETVPDLDMFKDCIGHKIPNSMPGQAKILYGLYQHAINHTDLLNNKDDFLKLGNIKLIPTSYTNGTFSYFSELCDLNNQIDPQKRYLFFDIEQFTKNKNHVKNDYSTSKPKNESSKVNNDISHDNFEDKSKLGSEYYDKIITDNKKWWEFWK